VESNERAFDASTRDGVLEIKGHAFQCVVLEFKNCLLFIE
jgi:hypothetical protein